MANFGKWGSAALMLCCMALTSHAAETRTTVRLGNQFRSFAIHLPEGTPSDAASPRGLPVILAFHGGGMQGAGMRRVTRLDALADARRFIVVYPDGIDKHWNDGRATIRRPRDDVGFVAALLDQLAARYPVDRDRVFATGMSNGALFVERLACDLPQRIAAIAPVAGTMPVEIESTCHPARRVAVLQIDGDADPIMPYGGGTVADFGGRGEGGSVVSVADTAGFWARRNGCGAVNAPEPLAPLVPLDPTRIVRMRYTHCPAAAPVTVLTVVGGGHAWPGGAQAPRPAIIGRISQQLDASGAVVDFFLSLPER